MLFRSVGAGTDRNVGATPILSLEGALGYQLIPMVMTLLICGLLLVFASSTGLGPFIYSLF